MTQIAQKTLRDMLQEIEDAISKGRRDDAETKCQQILTQFPESLEAQRLLGEVFLAQGKLEEAQQAFDWVLTNDPENVVTYCDRALISERLSDYDTALDCYQQAYELSRGNSKIRQQFNQLSQKAGQQGFMLSRAGLARLYMRGDLLTQAVQEWEAILALVPDRLDARTGLLETYWREGAYDRVEQLAERVLHDVPGCEKALLLLAYVTSLKSMSQAQELIRRVELLDPDLLMAHDLFSDLLASQPAEPFLDLLKKPPVLLTSPAPSTISISASKESLPSREEAQKDSLIPTWESLEQWSSSPLSAQAPLEEKTDAPPSIWSAPQQAEEPSWADFVSGSSAEANQQPSLLDAQPAASSIQQQYEHRWYTTDQDEDEQAAQSGAQPEPWEMLQDALSKVNAEGGNLSSLSPEVWASLDKYLQANNAPNPEQASPAPQMPEPPALSSTPEKQPTAPAQPVPETPAWMNSLSQSSRRQSGALPEGSEYQNGHAPTSNRQSSDLSTWSGSQPAITAQPSSSYSPPEDAWNSSPASQVENDQEAEGEDAEDSFFGPAWLRSLGAAGFEDGQTTVDKDKTIVPETAASQMSPLPQYNMWSSPEQKEQSPSWIDALNQPAPAYDAEVESHSSQSQPTEPSWMSSLQPSGEEQSFSSGQEPPWMDSLRQSSEPSWFSSLQPSSGPSWMDALQMESEAKAPAPTPTSYDLPSQETVPTPEAQDDPLLTTLRALEQDLMAQGFVPLEPNSLSSLAQAEAKTQPEQLPPAPPANQPSLSSALAELGGFVNPPAKAPEQPTAPFWPSTVPSALPQRVKEEAFSGPAQAVTRDEEPTQKSQAPSTLSQFASYREAPPIPPTTPPPTLATQAAEYQATPAVSYPTTPVTRSSQVPEAPASEEQITSFDFKPSPPQIEPAAPSVVHIDPLPDSELETTMKRPAIRLQPTRSSSGRDSSPAGFAKNRATGEARSVGNRGGEQGLSNQERLIAGYQHQLVGDYDEAMQEYRLIIRSAPDLLGEVISNVRALLKLAPKYSAGYRVLGDAYMRQGEYLQAMEAYNKALTIAKKK